MNITQIEENIKELLTDFQTNNVTKAQFVYDFLLAYGHRKSSVSRVKSGERNLSKVAGEVRWKRHVYFKYVVGDNLRLEADKLKNDKTVARDRIRFVIVTDFTKFLAIDIKTGDSLDINFDELVKHFDFFLPWAGMEKAVYQGENPADVKAAEKMAKLFDIIKADNFNETNKNDTEALHNLNVFLTRLLFCFFAEDTEIFTINQFSHAIESHTKADGTDVADYLNRLFTVLNTSDAKRSNLPDYLAKFPFVNGGLFAKELPAPVFSTKSRKMLIECGSELDWSDINPDIFGSMIQAVVHPEQRGGMGMHYTSVTNIMKVIEPLFLDELYDELENIQFYIDEKLVPSRLRRLKNRLAHIKIFDPACGSGNFLIIAFKELRKIEMDVIKLLQEIDDEKHQNQDDLFADVGLDSSFSEIKLSQFYGIELDDFAHEVAILSLWLAEHQMNIEFKTEFGDCEPTLPLQKGGNILSGNSVTASWEECCQINRSEEVFIIGNPPYLGSSMQSSEQKSDLANICKELKNYKNLDYIACWFVKAALFIEKNSNAKAAFVSTNSICQGEQIGLLWPYIFSKNVDIDFAHQSFKWANNAKAKAAVICVIVALKNNSQNSKKYLFNETSKWLVSNINPYLTEGSNICLLRRSKPISNIPPMVYGNKATDNGYLFLNKEERDRLLDVNPESHNFIKKLVGSAEFIKGINKWCIWVEDKDYDEAIKIPEIFNRFKLITEWRKTSKAKCTVKFAAYPNKFKQITYRNSPSIVIPRVSSERRKYIPFGFQDENTIILDSAQAIYAPDPYIFGIINSRMHVVWVKATSGRLKSDIRYSSALSYNNYPVPEVTESDKDDIVTLALAILEARENHPMRSISELYDPNKMPEDLSNAHMELDLRVDKLYSEKVFKNDEDRLQAMFILFSEMTGGQNA